MNKNLRSDHMKTKIQATVVAADGAIRTATERSQLPRGYEVGSGYQHITIGGYRGTEHRDYIASEREKEEGLGGFDIMHQRKVVGRVEFGAKSEKPVLHIEKRHQAAGHVLANALKTAGEWRSKPTVTLARAVLPTSEHFEANVPRLNLATPVQQPPAKRRLLDLFRRSRK
ncbi:MAG: hypothetical protein Q8R15_02325 [Candidatus Micrarchaeota archaeon]|nr:hypothetical protein [Candidatus Micrarchaeota archaeon]